MGYPRLISRGVQRVVTDTFAGYDHVMKIPDGEWYNTQNLTCMRYPMFSPRPKRGTMGLNVAAYSNTATYAVGDHCTHDNKLYRCSTAITIAEAWNANHWTQVTSVFQNMQGIIAKDALYWVAGGTMYANGYPTGLTGLSSGEKQLVSMGAYICVFPDKKYLNTMDLTDFGSMEASWSDTQTVTYSMCHIDGTIYDNVVKASSEPANPVNGMVWIDTANGVVKEYSVSTTMWTVIETVYTRVDFTSTGQVAAQFKELDGVQISGLSEDYSSDLNGSKILYKISEPEEEDYIVIIGIQEESFYESATFTIERKLPYMNYVWEAQNRLWGCFYGNDGTQNLNEIYCCALGDFRNWEQYLGVATDSWRASRGSDGPWTGCINYLGSPTFFKENVIDPVSVSSVGAHQVGDFPARGVQQGSYKSLAVVGETLYYKSRTGIMAYQGGIPAEVGQALGEERYYDAVAGAFGERYYISMKDSQNVWHLFCYDVKKGIWMREDNLHVHQFAQWGDELYAWVDGDQIIALNGTEGTLETTVNWFAETGIQYYQQIDRKYLSRYNIRLNMEQGAKLQIFFEYDSSGLWEFAQEVKLPVTGTAMIPVRPRRCDHMRMRLEGSGDVRIFSIARILEQGSDA